MSPNSKIQKIQCSLRAQEPSSAPGGDGAWNAFEEVTNSSHVESTALQFLPPAAPGLLLSHRGWAASLLTATGARRATNRDASPHKETCPGISGNTRKLPALLRALTTLN